MPIFFMRQMQVGGGNAMSFGKSRAKLLTENQHRVTFSDVAGVDESEQRRVQRLCDVEVAPRRAAGLLAVDVERPHLGEAEDVLAAGEAARASGRAAARRAEPRPRRPGARRG